MDFEWDPEKRKSNLAKHDVDFEDVTTVFDDFPVIIIDSRKEYGELRYKAIGVLKGTEVLVIFTDRFVAGKPVRRIISARRASRSEKQTYRQRIEGPDQLGSGPEHDR